MPLPYISYITLHYKITNTQPKRCDICSHPTGIWSEENIRAFCILQNNNLTNLLNFPISIFMNHFSTLKHDQTCRFHLTISRVRHVLSTQIKISCPAVASSVIMFVSSFVKIGQLFQNFSRLQTACWSRKLTFPFSWSRVKRKGKVIQLQARSGPEGG